MITDTHAFHVQFPYDDFWNAYSFLDSPFRTVETVGILLLFSCFALVGFVVLLLLIRSQISEPLMGSVVIVEINIFCNRNLEFCLSFIEMLAKILLFDGCEEGLDHSIIVGAARCGEGLRDPIFPQLLTEIEGSILSALVAVKKQSFRTLPRLIGAFKGLRNEVFINVLRHCIRDDLTGIEVNHNA